jgi:predicted Zn-dependent protease
MTKQLASLKLHSLSLSRMAFLAAIVLFTQCARNPVTGKKQLNFMSESQEKALGQEADPQIQAEYGVYPDSSLQRYLTEKGQSMAKLSHRPDLGFQFKVMDSHIVNAFAVPGGYVYFTRGILAHFNNEAQLMGVLGHEIGHVTARHGARQQTSSILSQIGMIGAIIAVPQLAQFGEQLGAGVQLLGLRFSRDHERESDKLGVDYSSRTGYDAKEMAKFFNTLGRMSKGEDGAQGIPTFMSTHPDPDDRFASVTKMAQEFQTANPNQEYKINRDGYLRLIDGMVYGEDPRQGYVSNNVFYHPELKFQFPIPKGWKYQNSPSQFQMVSSDQKAMMVLALSPEKSLSEAADGATKKFSLKVLDRQNRTVNGLPAIIQVADQVPQQQQGQPQQQQSPEQAVRVATIFIEYGGLIYHIHGVSSQALFPNHENTFRQTMFGFAQLNDASKINVSPEKIRIRTASNDGTFTEVMRALGTSDSRMKELALLNGMEVTDRITRGTLLKTVAK